VRGELSGKRRRDVCGGRWPSLETGETTMHRPNSSRGAVSGAHSGLRVSAEGGGALRHAGVRRGGRAWKKIKWEEGGPAASQAACGERLARAATRGVREGGELWQDPGPAGCGR
jgi:hypothetical protein